MTFSALWLLFGLAVLIRWWRGRRLNKDRAGVLGRDFEGF